MNSQRSPVVWKVRALKAYAEAHTHLLIGELVSRDNVAVELHCRSFHFGRSVNSLRDVHAGEFTVRIIPWSQIEVINVLPAEFRPDQAELAFDREGNAVLEDHGFACPIVTSREPRH